MRCLLVFLSFGLLLSCTTKNNTEQTTKISTVIVDFEIIHQSKFEVLGDYSFEILKNQQEVDNLYKYLSASPKGLRAIPIPSYEENETLIAVSATPKTKNDIDIKNVNLVDGKLNIEIIDSENPQLPKDSRYKSLMIIKLLKKYDTKTINLITK